MKLKGKILTGFAVVVIMPALLAGYTIIKINQVSDSVDGLQSEASRFDEVVVEVDNLKSNAVPVYKKTVELIKIIELIKSIFKDSIEDADIELLEDITDPSDRFLKISDDITKKLDGSEVKKIKIIMDLFRDYISSGKKNSEAFIKGESFDLSSIGKVSVELRQKITKLYSQKEKEIINNMNTVSRLNLEFKEDLLNATNEINSRNSHLRTFLPAISVAVLVAGILIAVLLTKFAIVIPINKMIERIKDIAEGEGDLTRRVEIETKDEIGELAKWFNIFVINSQNMIVQIKNHATVLASSAKELSAVSDQLASGSGRMSAQSNTVASATEEISTNINSMASAADEMSANIESVSSEAKQMSGNMNAISSAVEEMTISIDNIAGNAKKSLDVSGQAVDMSGSASSTMDELGIAAEKIGKVTDVIKRIAEQTNLLALNATIEAASAGEAGKGFAVVANEIKELAGKSSQAAEDIANRIGGVQTSTKNAVQVIKDVSAIINTIGQAVKVITDAVDQQTTTANEISVNVTKAADGANKVAVSIEEISKGINDLSRNVGEAAKGTNETAVNIQEVNKSASDSNSNARHINMSSTQLAKIAGELQEIVERFKV